MFKQLYNLYGFDIFKILKDIHVYLNISINASFILATMIVDNMKTLTVTKFCKTYNMDEKDVKKYINELRENDLIETKLEYTQDKKTKETIYYDNTFLKIEQYFKKLANEKENINDTLLQITSLLKEKVAYKISFEEINLLKLWLKEEKYKKEDILNEITYLIEKDVFTFKKLKTLLEKYDSKEEKVLTQYELDILKDLK